jgi:hypothetical protein
MFWLTPSPGRTGGLQLRGHSAGGHDNPYPDFSVKEQCVANYGQSTSLSSFTGLKASDTQREAWAMSEMDDIAWEAPLPLLAWIFLLSIQHLLCTGSNSSMLRMFRVRNWHHRLASAAGPFAAGTDRNMLETAFCCSSAVQEWL